MDDLLAEHRVLVVEDEMMVLISIEDMLAELGCRSITVAATVEEALALIGSRTFDLAMLDLNLGGTKSDPVADALTAHGIPFLFSTGYAENEACARYPGRPILHKPYSFGKLLSALRALIGEPPAAMGMENAG